MRLRALALALALLSTGCEQAPAPTPATSPELRIVGRQLQTAGGRPLLLRGINLQYGDAPGERWPAIAAIAGTGANAVRLQLRRETSAEQLRAALDAIVGHGMVAIPMYYGEDLTCGDSADALQQAVQHWQHDWRAVLQSPRYQGRLILNIANEWGRSDSEEQRRAYFQHYRQAVLALRQAGYTQPLMIDAPNCGQDFMALGDGLGQQLLASDPLQNLLISLHAYWHYPTPDRIRAAAYLFKNAQLAFVWGEFGNRWFQAAQGHATDHRYLMRHANRAGIGYLAWSWYGNGGEARVLDLSTASHGGPLTDYGREVIEGSWLHAWPVQGLRASSELPGR